MCRLLEPTQRHVIKLPQLSQEEMEILRQKSAKPLDILMQGLALSLYGEKDGFYRALEVLLKSCKDVSSEPAKEMLERKITLLRKGHVLSWRKLCEMANKRPDSPVCRIVLQISPLNKRREAA